MLSVTQLARRCGVSRSAVLYYERKGLLLPAIRSENGYRWYGEKQVKTLRNILAYRSYGLSVAQIADLVCRQDGVAQERILRDQFHAHEREISNLRQQQKAIVQLLNQPHLLEKQMVTKERWVEIMRAAGLSEEEMLNWHRNFEKMEPEEHRKFLESLGIPADEVERIRAL